MTIRFMYNNASNTPNLNNLKDKSMSDGIFLIHLLSSIEPRMVNWDIVMHDGDDASKENNAKYVLSIARKLQAVVFCVWDQIVSVNPKQMLILFCAIQEVKNTYVPPE